MRRSGGGAPVTVPLMVIARPNRSSKRPACARRPPTTWRRPTPGSTRSCGGRRSSATTAWATGSAPRSGSSGRTSRSYAPTSCGAPTTSSSAHGRGEGPGRRVCQRRQPRPGRGLRCRHLGVPGRIVVPRTTPRQKRERITAIGGDLVTLVVTGDTYDDANLAAVEDAMASGRVLVAPFDHPMTIAGQGTVAVEIVRQLGHAPDVLVVPVGGGGLLAGVSTWLRARHPATGSWGSRRPGRLLAAAVAAGEPHPETSTASSTGPPSAGPDRSTISIVNDLIDELVTVEEGGSARDARPVPVGGHRGRAGRLPSPRLPSGTACRSNPTRRWCACCRVATTTSAATARSSSGR